MACVAETVSPVRYCYETDRRRRRCARQFPALCHGSQAVTIYDTFAFSSDPPLTLEAVLECLDELFTPRCNHIHERAMFKRLTLQFVSKMWQFLRLLSIFLRR